MATDDPELEAIRARKLQELLNSASTPAPTVAVSASGKPVLLTDATFDSEVRKPGVLLVDFWAAWCGPCLRVAPTLETIAKDQAGRMRLGKLNVDENPRTAQRFQVMSIPTMLLFKDGKLVDGMVGAMPRPQIEAFLRKWT
ncbi:MAG TPA: thioredoxin, partial [Thermoplasmata archaeon]|nr:thioredoxin [Thermoplasmata archaeon]